VGEAGRCSGPNVNRDVTCSRRVKFVQQRRVGVLRHFLPSAVFGLRRCPRIRRLIQVRFNLFPQRPQVVATQIVTDHRVDFFGNIVECFAVCPGFGVLCFGDDVFSCHFWGSGIVAIFVLFLIPSIAVTILIVRPAASVLVTFRIIATAISMAAMVVAGLAFLVVILGFVLIFILLVLILAFLVLDLLVFALIIFAFLWATTTLSLATSRPTATRDTAAAAAVSATAATSDGDGGFV